jgi:hypothetical protein
MAVGLSSAAVGSETLVGLSQEQHNWDNLESLILSITRWAKQRQTRAATHRQNPTQTLDYNRRRCFGNLCDDLGKSRGRRRQTRKQLNLRVPYQYAKCTWTAA